MSTDPKQMEPASLRDVIVDALDEEVHYASPVIDRLIDEVEAHVRWTMNGVDALQQVAIADWERECERLKAKVARVEALASGLQEQYEASDYSETASLGEIVKAIRAALAEPERDEEGGR